MLRHRRAMLIGIFVLTTACNKQEVRPPAPAPAPQNPLAEQETEDRRELVTPAPDDFQPQSAAAELKLTLFAENTTLHVGQKLRYRLDIQNVGAKDYDYDEKPSFIKIGENAYFNHYKFILTRPDGWTSTMYPPTPDFGARPQAPDLPFDKMTDLERAAAEKKIDADNLERTVLFLSLHPGETLSTRPDLPAPSRFRTLLSETAYDKPGIYRIKIVYETGTGDEGIRVESNSISFEVVP